MKFLLFRRLLVKEEKNQNKQTLNINKKDKSADYISEAVYQQYEL